MRGALGPPRRGQAGFTLIELTVSLLAGLIVAMGVVALSRASTNTFHEEMRSSAAEANLRTAADRLRADLGRAGYMSSPNLTFDPVVAKALGATNPAAASGLPGLMALASVQLVNGGSLANDIPLSGLNQLSPDVLLIGGNMTTTDMYPAHLQAKVASNGCQEIDIDPQSPALYRLLGSTPPANQATELQNAFQPVAGQQFMIRIVDATLRTQYVATCPGQGQATAIQGTAPGWVVSVFVAPATPVLTADKVPTSQVTPMTGIWINPVQLVRWEIMPATSEAAPIAALAGQPMSPGSPDPNKYDLVRSYVNITPGGYPAAVPGSTEIIAEYATDFRVAFAVDQGLTALNPQMSTFAFDDETNNQRFANDVFLVQTPNQGPERIRSVRVRLSTRAAQADRALNIPLIPVPNTPTSFLYRYCVLSGGCDPTSTSGVLQYARMRTLTTEVSMHNQSTSYW